MKEREEAIQELTDEINKKADHVVELENKVETLTKQLEEKYLAGKKDGKTEADKSNAFEVRSLNMKNEFEQKSLQCFLWLYYLYKFFTRKKEISLQKQSRLRFL